MDLGLTSQGLCSGFLQLRLTVYSLANSGHRLVILNPRVASAGAASQQSRLHQWSVDNRYLYLAERHNSKDSVAVYDSLSAFSLMAVSESDICGSDRVAER